MVYILVPNFHLTSFSKLWYYRNYEKAVIVVEKNTKDLLKAVSWIPVILLMPLILFILLLAILFGTVFIAREVQHHEIRSEVFEYVEENKDSIELKSPEYTQYFIYADDGFWDAGVIYGYFYSPVDENINGCEEYRGGFRREGLTSYGDGWFYFEEICENWYYYEEHYGWFSFT